MDMKTQPKLNTMQVGSKYSLTGSILEDVQHSKHFQRAFQNSFFSFVDVVGALVFQMGVEERETLRTIYSLSIVVKHDPEEFIKPFMLQEYSESDSKSEYLALFQNAFIYAVAACYKSQIKGTYMRASEGSRLTQEEATEFMITGKARGSRLAAGPDDRARYSDRSYANYMITRHPLFANFVKSKHRFQNKKILATAGYMINPGLVDQ